MPLPVRRVLVGLLLTLLPALAADAVLPVATASTAAAQGWGENALAAQPAFSSGVYAVTQYITGASYPGTWTLTVTGGVISGISEWGCCPGPRRDPMTGTAQGSHVVIVRDCSGQGLGPCSQTFVGDVDAYGNISGTWSGSYAAAGGTTWEGTCISGACLPLHEEEDDTKPPVVKAFPAAGQPGKKVKLRFTIEDDSDIVDCEITVFLGATVVGRKGCGLPLRRPGVKWVTWDVPKRFRDGPSVLRFCVNAWDSAGNEGKRCAKIRLRRQN